MSAAALGKITEHPVRKRLGAALFPLPEAFLFFQHLQFPIRRIGDFGITRERVMFLNVCSLALLERKTSIATGQQCGVSFVTDILARRVLAGVVDEQRDSGFIPDRNGV